MRIIRKKFSDWDATTKQKLYYATLPGGYLKLFMRGFPDSPTIIMYNRKHIVGWAFALCMDNSVSLSLFVNRRYRRMGVAKLLIKEALKDFPSLALAEWDDITKRFFGKMLIKYPSRIRVFNWWKQRHYHKRYTF